MYRYIYLQGVNLGVTFWVSTCSTLQNKTKPHFRVDATINIHPKRLYEFSLFYTPTSLMVIKWNLLWL